MIYVVFIVYLCITQLNLSVCHRSYLRENVASLKKSQIQENSDKNNDKSVIINKSTDEVHTTPSENSEINIYKGKLLNYLSSIQNLGNAMMKMYDTGSKKQEIQKKIGKNITINFSYFKNNLKLYGSQFGYFFFVSTM